jgi:hypothetical protein
VAKESIIMGIVTTIATTGAHPVALDPKVASDRLRAISQEIERLQRRWTIVQARIDRLSEPRKAGTAGTQKIKLQAAVTEGDRLLLMIAQLEKARATLIADDIP